MGDFVSAGSDGLSLPAGLLFVPDASLTEPPAPLTADPSGIDNNRYLSFSAGDGTEPELIRVTLVDVPGFADFNGEKRWAGTPAEFPDEGLGTFVAAELQCDMPDAADFSSFDLISVYGAEIVPGSTYHVQRASADCPASLDDDDCFSEPLVVTTGKWGDVAAPFGGNGQPDFTDIASLVDKFQSLPSGPPKARAQLQPNIARPISPIDFSDIAADIDAFSGASYAFDGPMSCP